MAKLKTEKMPSGAQQYVRGKTTADKMDTIIKSKKSPSGRGTNAYLKLTDSFLDVSKKSLKDRATRDRKAGTAGANIKKKK